MRRPEEEHERDVRGGETVERAGGHACCREAAELIDVGPRWRCKEHAKEGDEEAAPNARTPHGA
eukprot:9453437-Heterocapsa_arctica.AAC.1